jgi:hypothetical protein
MDVLLAAHPHFAQRAHHDKPSPTHDRRHAGAESRAEYPVKLPSAGLAVCTILQTAWLFRCTDEHLAHCRYFPLDNNVGWKDYCSPARKRCCSFYRPTIKIKPIEYASKRPYLHPELCSWPYFFPDLCSSAIDACATQTKQPGENDPELRTHHSYNFRNRVQCRASTARRVLLLCPQKRGKPS